MALESDNWGLVLSFTIYYVTMDDLLCASVVSSTNGVIMVPDFNK